MNGWGEEMSTSKDLSELGVSQYTMVAVEKLAETFNNLTKDLPDNAKVALASFLTGSVVTAGSMILGKKL
jgi:hypothetical protein